MPAKHAAQIIARVKRYAIDPQSVPAQKVQNYPGLLRLRAGEYRVIFSVVSGEMHVLVIDKRNDGQSYRRLERLFR